MSVIRFGVVGTSWITDSFIAAAKDEKRVTFTSVCSRKLETAQEFAKKHGLQHCFTDVSEMCKCPDVDAIYIALPNALHAECAITCMNMKKHVLCEKPLAGNYEDAKRMVECAKQNNVLLMEGMRLTLSPVFKAIKDNLHKIGPIHKFVSLFCQYSSKFERFKQGMSFSSFSADTAGGSLMDIGVYTVYPTICLFGEPKQIYCVGSLLKTGVDMEATIICSYDDGKSAVLVSSKVSNSIGDSEIQGEKGTILINKMNTFKSAKIVYNDGKEEELCTSKYSNDLIYEISEFVDVIQNGKLESEINSHQNSLLTMKILDEARRQLGIKV